jgi:hypothetical protein
VSGITTSQLLKGNTHAGMGALVAQANQARQAGQISNQQYVQTVADLIAVEKTLLGIESAAKDLAAVAGAVTGPSGGDITSGHTAGRRRKHAAGQPNLSMSTFAGDVPAGGGTGASHHFSPSQHGNAGSMVIVHPGAIVVHESGNPQKTYEATRRGLADAMART